MTSRPIRAKVSAASEESSIREASEESAPKKTHGTRSRSKKEAAAAAAATAKAAAAAAEKRNKTKNQIDKVAKKSAIRRLARRGGAKRISGTLYEEARGIMKDFVKGLKTDSVAYTEHGKRSTVTAMDVVYALRKRGRHLYGYS